MKRVIRLGDPTDHGGFVTGASATTSMFGKQVALIGDPVSCPQQGHVNCVIVEGDPSWTVGGRGVALEGHKVSCGATLISTMPEVGRSYEGSGSGSGSAGTAHMSPLLAALPGAPKLGYDMHFVLEGEQSGKPLANVPYKLTLEDGTEILGKTDKKGLTEKISAAYPAIATIIAPYYDDNQHDDTDEADSDCGCGSCLSEIA